MTNAHRPVTIYISAAADLMIERERLARMMAALPVTLAWQIFQTPLGDDIFDPTPLAAADLHLLLLGGDIRAPVGAELYAARQVGCPTVAFAKRGITRTTAGQIFVNDSRLSWRSFTDVAHLIRQVQTLLVQHLLDQAGHYVLTPVEIEQLEALKRSDHADPQTSGEATTRRTEAGHSAVILSRKRYSPKEGIVVDD